jgi:DNA-binding beta-propeller fold protein YncE
MALVVVVAVLAPSSKAGAVVTPRYLRQWTVPLQSADPGIAVDRLGEVLVSNGYEGLVDVFTRTGQLIRKFGTGGVGLGWPAGIATDNYGHVFVAYAGPDRVEEYDSSGTLIRRIGTSGGYGQLSGAFGVAVDGAGKLYVANQTQYPAYRRVNVYSSSGSFLGDFGIGRFGDPLGVAAGGDDVYVADAQLNHVYVSDIAGGFDGTFGLAGYGPGHFYGPEGMAVRDGLVYVTDSQNNRVEIFDQSGHFLTEFGSSGTGNVGLPTAVAVDGQGDIYVVDNNSGRVEVFGP